MIEQTVIIMWVETTPYLIVCTRADPINRWLYNLVW